MFSNMTGSVLKFVDALKLFCRKEEVSDEVLFDITVITHVLLLLLLLLHPVACSTPLRTNPIFVSA
jgi:hypothetical protein